MRAFTLLEVLIAIALLALMLTILASFFVSATGTYEYQSAAMRQDREVRIVAQRIEENVREARAVADTHAFGMEARATSDRTLVLELPALDTEGEVIDGYVDHIAFYAQGNIVYEEIDAAPGSARESGRRTLSSVIEELEFSYDSAPASEVRAVIIDVVARALVREKEVQGSITRTLYLRNAPQQ